MSFRFCVLTLGLLAVGFAAPAAQAAGSASMNVTVQIPPIAAALAARNEGAVGIQTLDGGSGGLMIAAPETVSTTGGTLFIQNGSLNAFSASLQTPSNNGTPGFTLVQGAQTTLNGMTRTYFSLVPQQQGVQGAQGTVNLVIAGQ